MAKRFEVSANGLGGSQEVTADYFAAGENGGIEFFTNGERTACFYGVQYVTEAAPEPVVEWRMTTDEFAAFLEKTLAALRAAQ